MSAFSNRKQGRIRSSRNGTIGGSDPAFRATNKVILLWINRTLNTSFSSLTDACNGAAHCQLCHMLHPSAFGADWKKVNWTAKNDYELMNNYSILNRAFNKANIKQNVPVEALAKGKKVENLKFWQWMMGYWQMNQRQVDEGYDTDVARLKCKNGSAFARAKAGKPSANNFLQQSRERRKRPGKIENLESSPRSPRPVHALESPRFRPPSPISTPRNEPKKSQDEKSYIWAEHEEELAFKFSSPNSPLSKHVQSWEQRKADLIKSAEKNARFAPSLHRKVDAHHQQQNFHDNGNNKFVPQNFLQPWLEVQQGQQSQPALDMHRGMYGSGPNMQGMPQQQFYPNNQQVTASVNVDFNGVPHVQYNYGDYSSQENSQDYVMQNQQHHQQPMLHGYEQNYQQNPQPPSYSNAVSPHHGVIAPYRSALPDDNDAFNIDININANNMFAGQKVDPQEDVLSHYSNAKRTEQSENRSPRQSYAAANRDSAETKPRKSEVSQPKKRNPRKRRTVNKRNEKPNPFKSKLVQRKPEPRNDKPVPSYMRSTAATRLWKDTTAAEKKKPKSKRTEIY